MARKKPAAAGVPEWLVTFADLMSILVCFFVLIISFSIQDDEKLQVVAGSMREAFGIVEEFSRAAVIEQDGNPFREYIRTMTEDELPIEPEASQEPPTEPVDDAVAEAEAADPAALAAASLRQAWRDMPDITAVLDNLILEETPEGLNILIVDQEGRPMFPDGSRHPFETTRRALAAMAPLLQRMPNQIRISGHTAAAFTPADPGYSNWELTSDRANVTRQILEEFGLSPSRVEAVIGRADTEPYFANDPYLAANQRIEITLMIENPAVPLGFAF